MHRFEEKVGLAYKLMSTVISKENQQNESKNIDI